MKTRRTSTISVFSFATLILVCIVSCEAPDSVLEGNPFDPNDPSYQPPETTIVGWPMDGKIVGDANVTFSWSGNEGVTEYSYRLDEAARSDEGVWSGWAPAKSVTFELLNEGDYTFSVKARYPTGIQEAPPKTRTFTVDAVAGPALMLYPRSQTVQVGETFSVQVMLEDVAGVALAHVVARYDATQLRFIDAVEGPLLLSADGNDKPAFLETPGLAGTVDISIGAAPGNPPLDSTGAITTLTFEALPSLLESDIRLVQPTELRGSRNERLNVLDMTRAKVIKQP